MRALLVQSLTRTDFRLLSVLSTDREDHTVEVRAELVGDQRDDAQMEAAVSRLSLEPSVSSVRWEAVPA
ncbi:hypothetical protein [Amycolatopsis sp. A133]|uniref:hypothetical protein n=1 Tax=Amycolatopsis sp. A133 TaxID=3064472 RepID=UPI0037C08C25